MTFHCYVSNSQVDKSKNKLHYKIFPI